MQILIYHGKHGDEYLLADTPQRLNAAKAHLFNLFDLLEFYDNEDEAELLKARQGDAMCIDRILHRRLNCEYEQWELVEAVDPCTD